MSRFRANPVRSRAVLSALLLTFVAGLTACDDDGKTAPERCLDPALPIFDIQAAGVPADDNAQYPCVTPIGHSVSYIGSPTATAGTGAGGNGDTVSANAGAGGAP